MLGFLVLLVAVNSAVLDSAKVSQDWDRLFRVILTLYQPDGITIDTDYLLSLFSLLHHEQQRLCLAFNYTIGLLGLESSELGLKLVACIL